MTALDRWEKLRMVQTHISRAQSILDDLSDDAAKELEKQAKGRN